MKRLEPDAGKLASPVLRGEWRSNALFLPDKVQLIGRLGKDPEIRYTQGSEAVTTVSLATSESWKDKNGEKQEKTEWHNLVFYRRLAEVVGEHLKKGALIYVEGKITIEKYQKDGEDRYVTKIVVSEMKMLGGNKADGESHVAAPAPAASAANKGKTTKAGQKPEFEGPF